MLVQREAIHPSAPGLAFVALLLVGLARLSVLAWTLLLVWNHFATLAFGLVSGGGSGSGEWLLPSALLSLSSAACDEAGRLAYAERCLISAVVTTTRAHHQPRWSRNAP